MGLGRLSYPSLSANMVRPIGRKRGSVAVPGASYSTPLLALDAIVLDTETTGLDARNARIVQIGALRLSGGILRTEDRFESLVNPGGPIPKTAIAIHGITDDMVATAPAFPDVAPDLEAFAGRAIVVGYAIHYDLAVLEREYALAGRPWPRFRALDVRMLARLAAPSLADHSLERLCEWLGIEIKGRHTALGDAEAAGHIFIALLPLLRAKNIRTLAEAEAASRTLAESEARSTGGYVPASTGPVDDTRALARIDSFPYRHLVRDVMSAPALFAPPETTVRDAMRLLIENAGEQCVRARGVGPDRHRHRARPPARPRRGRRGHNVGGHRDDHEGPAADRCRGCLPLPCHRPHRAHGIPAPGRRATPLERSSVR